MTEPIPEQYSNPPPPQEQEEVPTVGPVADPEPEPDQED